MNIGVGGRVLQCSGDAAAAGWVVGLLVVAALRWLRAEIGWRLPVETGDDWRLLCLAHWLREQSTSNQQADNNQPF